MSWWSGRRWGVAFYLLLVKSLAVNAPIGREVTPMTEKPVETRPLKIMIRRGAEAPSSQPIPLVTVVNTFPIHLRVQLVNARRKAPFQAISTLKEPEPIARTAVAVSDLSPGLSAIEDDDLAQITRSPPPRRPKAIVPPLKFSTYPSWFERCRKTIEDRGGPIDEPFTGVSEAVLCSLEAAEKTPGGSKRILAKVQAIGQNTLIRQVSNVFSDDDMDEAREAEPHDSSGEEHSQDLLECARWMMLIEARTQESSNTKSQATKIQKNMVPTRIPPGGLLRTRNGPNESIPAMESLDIGQYSNDRYWQFRPHLDPVRYELMS